VRLGNVLGSRASVVPIFQSQIRDGKSITVTHPDVRRYFMTIPEATSLVIQAGSIANGGELFVLDMGDPVRIVDLACQLIELSGLEPNHDIKIEYVGLRPGEKLYEELFLPSESQVRNTLYPKIFGVESNPPSSDFVETVYAPLVEAAQRGDIAEIKSLLRAMGIAYTQPSGSDGVTTMKGVQLQSTVVARDALV
jgi:FlaA1/EpsC-like NDP-sugar epimerase